MPYSYPNMALSGIPHSARQRHSHQGCPYATVALIGMTNYLAVYLSHLKSPPEP